MKSFNSLMESLMGNSVTSGILVAPLMPYSAAYHIQLYLSSTTGRLIADSSEMFNIQNYLIRLGYTLDLNEISNIFVTVANVLNNQTSREVIITLPIYLIGESTPIGNYRLEFAFIEMTENNFLFTAKLLPIS